MVTNCDYSSAHFLSFELLANQPKLNSSMEHPQSSRRSRSPLKEKSKCIQYRRYHLNEKDQSVRLWLTYLITIMAGAQDDIETETD